MARRNAKVGAAQKLTGYGILAVLGLIAVWLLIQQSRFNPAVIVAMRGPELTGRPQAASTQAQAATTALLPEVAGFTPLAPPRATARKPSPTRSTARPSSTSPRASKKCPAAASAWAP